MLDCWFGAQLHKSFFSMHTGLLIFILTFPKHERSRPTHTLRDNVMCVWCGCCVMIWLVRPCQLYPNWHAIENNEVLEACFYIRVVCYVFYPNGLETGIWCNILFLWKINEKGKGNWFKGKGIELRCVLEVCFAIQLLLYLIVI